MLLETRRTILRPLHPSDFDAMHAFNSDADSMQYVGNNLPMPAHVTRAWIEASERHHAEYGYGECAVIDRATGQFIGWAGVFRSRDTKHTGEVEVSYGLVASHRGQGIATEIASALVDYAFETLNVRRILATIDPDNIASIRVAEKLGFVLKETKPDEHGFDTYFFWKERGE
jgi:[ribosomal protein S5]-alanine N-acetyltransferase